MKMYLKKMLMLYSGMIFVQMKKVLNKCGITLDIDSKKFVIDTHLICYCKKNKVQGSPWITGEYLSIAHDRDHFKRKFDTDKSPEHWEKYRKLRNAVNVMNRKLKKNYYKNLCNKNCGDIK